jgi:hypothetical protein
VAKEIADLPAEEEAPSAVAPDAAASAADVKSTAADVETLDGLKAELADTKKRLRESNDPKRVEFWQSKSDRLENEMKTVTQRLQEQPTKWVNFIREGAARGLSAKEMLEHLEKNAAKSSEATQASKGSRADTLETILKEHDAGNTDFAKYLRKQLEAGTPISAGNLEMHRGIFNDLRPAENARKDESADDGSKKAATGNGRPAAPRVPGGSGGPSRAKGPAWQPGSKGVDLISKGLRGE